MLEGLLSMDIIYGEDVRKFLVKIIVQLVD
jgi:hypothetical protein